MLLFSNDSLQSAHFGRDLQMKYNTDCYFLQHHEKGSYVYENLEMVLLAVRQTIKDGD